MQKAIITMKNGDIHHVLFKNSDELRNTLKSMGVNQDDIIRLDLP